MLLHGLEYRLVRGVGQPGNPPLVGWMALLADPRLRRRNARIAKEAEWRSSKAPPILGETAYLREDRVWPVIDFSSAVAPARESS